MKINQTKLPKSQLELEFELTSEEFKHYIEHVLEHLKKHVKVDGFRPGQAPNKLVEDKIKPESLLMEAGDIAVQETYSKYVKKSNWEPVGHPEISIVKIAQGSPFIFKAKITILPNIELPDYKQIAKSVKGKEISVTEDEIQDSLNYLQKSRAKMTLKNDAAEKKDFVEIEYSCEEINNNQATKDQFILDEGGMIAGFEDNIVGMKAGEEKIFIIKFREKDTEFKVKMVSVQKMELPEINDEFAKSLGAFDTLVALKTSLKEGLMLEKREAEKQRRRAEILEKIAEKTKVELPDVMIEYEQKRLLEDLKNKISQTTKASFEDYLAAVKQTEQEIKETYQKEAEKRLRGFLVLREIGKKENIEVSDQEVEEEINKAPRGKFDIEQLKEYTKGVIMNEKIFQLLENFSS